MSERFQVKKDGEHRGWVRYAGVNVVDGVEQDEWVADIHDYLRYGLGKRFPSREAAIRWLVEEDAK